MPSADIRYAGDTQALSVPEPRPCDVLDVDIPPDLRTPAQRAAYYDMNLLLMKVYPTSRSARTVLVSDDGTGCAVPVGGFACDKLSTDDACWGEDDSLGNVPRKTYSLHERVKGDVDEFLIRACGKHARIPLAICELRIAPNLMARLKVRNDTKGRLRILDETETTILTLIRGAPVLVIDDGSLPSNMMVIDSKRSVR